MKRILKIAVLLFVFYFVIPISCKNTRIRILDINLNLTDKYFKDLEVFTKQSGLMIHVTTLYNKIAYFQKSASECYAFYDPSVEIINPIDTSTMRLYCNLNIVISADTILSESNLLSDYRIKEKIAIYDDRLGGYNFELSNDNDFYNDLNFLSNTENSILFTFQAKTVDNINLEDSIRINIDWQ